MKNKSIQDNFERADEIGYVFDAALEDSLTYALSHGDGMPSLILTEEYDNICQVREMEQLAPMLTNFTPPFLGSGPIVDGFSRCTGSVSREFRCFCDLSASRNWGVAVPSWTPSPYVKLLTATGDISDLHAHLSDDLQKNEDIYVECCKRVFKAVRVKKESPDFQAELDQWQARSTKKLWRTEVCIHQLFESYTHLLVVRLDVGYRLDADERWESQAINIALNELLTSPQSSSFFKEMVSSVVCINYRKHREFHAHMLLFFDGLKCTEDIKLGEAIGEYWSAVIADGYGTYWNCNRLNTGYKALGTGMVSRDDDEKRLHLLQALTYLAKTDLYFSLPLVSDA